MNIRLATSAPFPWLNVATGIIFGKKVKKSGAPKRRFVLRLPRSLKITREGKWFIGILFLIGVAAINTGNNLLYLVVAAMLSFIVISGVLSESTLRGIQAERQLPGHVFKGQAFIVRYRLKNAKRRLPSYSFSVVELASEGLKADPAYAVKLGAREETVRPAQCMFERRGRHALQGVRISTRFPFGLFLKGREERTEADIIVYPALKPPSSLSLRAISTKASDADRELLAFTKGNGTEIHGMRDYVHGEDARLIYWKSAAKRQRLLVKEFEKETERRVMVLFDNYSPNEGDPAFEEMVDEAAGIAKHFIDTGFSVGLRTLADEAPPAPGNAQLLKLLKTLALISPVIGGRGSIRIVYL